jgi:hypothetical protein
MPLSDQLERDLDWRIAELAELKKLALSLKDRPVAYATLLRALWIMLCAHYEGFCKFAISIFLEELEKTGKELKYFKDEIIIFSIEEKFNWLRNKSSLEQFYEYLTKTFNEVLESQIQFKRNKRCEYQIKGESNLYAKSLMEMCSCICISQKVIEENHLKLDTLVSRRNEIAHGRNHLVKSLNDYKNYEDAAFNVMIALALAIIDSLDNGEYLK